jgi:hypothetical protein
MLFKIHERIYPSKSKCAQNITATLHYVPSDRMIIGFAAAHTVHQMYYDYNSLDVVGLLVLFPVFIQLMNLACNITLLLQVKSLKEGK